MQMPLAFLGIPGGYEIVVVGFIALLLFGKRPPGVGPTRGKGMVELKKGLGGIEEGFRYDEHAMKNSYHPEPVTPPSALIESTVPKFEPPTAAPVRQADHQAPVTKD